MMLKKKFPVIISKFYKNSIILHNFFVKSIYLYIFVKLIFGTIISKFLIIFAVKLVRLRPVRPVSSEVLATEIKI